MKNYKTYGPSVLLWVIYLIVGVVAFFVSNVYFKFAFKEALIFGAINLVSVTIITEGIDWFFKKVKARKENKATDKQETDEVPSDEPVEEIASKESVEDASGDSVPAVEGHADDELPILITGAPGSGKNFHLLEYAVSLKNADSVDPEVNETIVDEDAKETPADDEAPLLITGRPGKGHGYWSGDHLAALKNIESAGAEAKATIVDADATASNVESPEPDSISHDNVEDAVVEQETEIPTKPRGRRANPDAVIDAPTSSIPIITPDMIKPRVEPVAVPVAVEPVVTVAAEPVVEKPYLSANDFLDSTKLTSPRAIVREYQRLGGKDDIYSVLAERKK